MAMGTANEFEELAMAPEFPDPGQALSEDERAAVEERARQIDLTDSSMILQYGAGTQKKMADFSQSALENVKTKDLGEIGELLSDVVKELKDFDVDEEEKGFFGIFKKASNRVQTLKNRYSKAETHISQITSTLEAHQRMLLKDVAILDKMYELNLSYFRDLTIYILAGKKKLGEMRDGKLKELIEKAHASGLPEDAQAAKDLESLCIRFEKKIHDLELTRTIAIQTAPQIKLIQNNDKILVDKIQTAILNTIPVWKSQIVIGLGLNRQKNSGAVRISAAVINIAVLRRRSYRL